MNQREAKRRICELAAEILSNSMSIADLELDQEDAQRMYRARNQLLDELSRRATPLRPSRERALRAILAAIRTWDAEMLARIEAGDVSIRLCEDGSAGDDPEKIGWAWWLVRDEEAPVPDDEDPDEREILGTCYVHNNLSIEGL